MVYMGIPLMQNARADPNGMYFYIFADVSQLHQLCQFVNDTTGLA
jgi:hypothetical protein